MAVLDTRNDALVANPPAGDSHLSTNGSNWLFTVMTVFGVSFVSRHAIPPDGAGTAQILTPSSSFSRP